MSCRVNRTGRRIISHKGGTLSHKDRSRSTGDASVIDLDQDEVSDANLGRHLNSNSVVLGDRSQIDEKFAGAEHDRFVHLTTGGVDQDRDSGADTGSATFCFKASSEVTGNSIGIENHGTVGSNHVVAIHTESGVIDGNAGRDFPGDPVGGLIKDEGPADGDRSDV